MEYRKRWRNTWDQVKYCSEACRRRGLSDADRELETAIIEVLGARSASSTICPSEVARIRKPEDWRPLMEPVRRAARRLARRGKVVIKQGGAVVDPSTASGPIRLGRGAQW